MAEQIDYPYGIAHDEDGQRVDLEERFETVDDALAFIDAEIDPDLNAYVFVAAPSA